MAGIKELLRSEKDGSLSFGDYTLRTKTKLEDYKHRGDIYKVKTFREMTRLEKNDTFLYESTPGTSVYNMKHTSEGVEFLLEGFEDAQITLDLDDGAQYEVKIDGESVGLMKTNISGKLSFGVELGGGTSVKVEIKQM